MNRKRVGGALLASAALAFIAALALRDPFRWAPRMPEGLALVLTLLAGLLLVGAVVLALGGVWLLRNAGRSGRE